MEIVSLSRPYWEKWNKFCIQSDDAWFWHTTWWMEYALKHNPEYAPALNNLALALQKRGCIEEATVESRKAVTLNPQDGQIRATLGVMLLELGRVQQQIFLLTPWRKSKIN